MASPIRLTAVLLAAFTVGFTPFAPGAETGHVHALENSTHVYQCSMHPWIKSATPGKCTICGMALVAVDAATGMTPDGIVTLAASQITTVGIATTRISRQPLARTLRVTGRIDDDDTRHRILAARVPGRVEKLFVTFAGQKVEADAPLVTMYSTEMLTAQRVYVERLKSGEGATSAADRAAARERLLELGLTDSDIAQLDRTLQPNALLTVRAPMSGTVVTKLVYEGQYVQTSDRLFEIADFSRMWFVFDAYEQDLPWIRVGQTVNITTRAFPGEVITAPIDFIDPNFNELTHTTKVRAIVPNPHAGMSGESHTLPHRVLAEGHVEVEASTVVAAPRSAILDTGSGPVAYVDLGNRSFEQRSLHLGRRGDNLVEVLAGLNEGDLVVTNGALLIDAQAQLAREANTHSHTQSPSATQVSPPAGETAPQRNNTSSASPLNASADTFGALASAAIDASEALAADDYAHYQKLFPSLTTAAKAFPTLPPLEPGTDLKSARLSFEPWSTAVADLLKPQRAQLGLKIFQCPMSPVLKKGRWVQRGEPLKNPFFGSTMTDCGEEIR